MPPKKFEKPTSTAVKGRGVSGFRSQEEKKWFENEFKSRGVFTERPLELPYPAIPQFKPFHERPQWHLPLSTVRECNATIVREFCASLIPINSDAYEYEAFVRGKKIFLSPTTVGSFLQVRVPKDSDYPQFKFPSDLVTDKNELVYFLSNKKFNEWPARDNRIPTKNFDYSFQIINLVIANCIIQTAHKADVDHETAKLMYAIGAGLVVSLPHVLIQGIVPPTVTRGASLRCGGLITGLCIREGVEVKASDEILRPGRPFDETSITRSLAQYQMISKKKKRVIEEEESDDEENEQQQGGAQGESSNQGHTRQSFLQVFDERMNRWDDRFNRIEARFDQWDTRLNQVGSRFDGLDERFNRMEARLDVFDQRFARVDERLDNINGRFQELGIDINNQLGNLELTSTNNFQRMHERMDGWEY